MAATIAAVLVFTGVILILVIILNFAEKRLLPQGKVTIEINEDKTNAIQIQPGLSLLSALSANQIFLPSACGGGGTCAMCKCQVIAG
ncbi:MAG: 2Fe-2S iron-sulfur cluster-binding protein, partial [Candidatus Neomarinimicrobiota bacterium]